LSVFLINALQQYGYPALWLTIFIAAAGAPLPASLVLFASAAFAALGDFNIIILFLVVWGAAVMGDNLGYLIGRRVGTILLAWLKRPKRFHWITLPALAQSQAYFRRRGGWAIFMTRFLFSALGGSINLLAGIEQYPYRNFLFWDVIGEALGAIIPLSLGYVFAETWEEIAGLFGAFSGLLLTLLIAIALSILLVQKIHQRRYASKSEGDTNDASQVFIDETACDSNSLFTHQIKRP
jgi:membrane protein DedA with SNARE-associated domain